MRLSYQALSLGSRLANPPSLLLPSILHAEASDVSIFRSQLSTENQFLGIFPRAKNWAPRGGVPIILHHISRLSGSLGGKRQPHFSSFLRTLSKDTPPAACFVQAVHRAYMSNNHITRLMDARTVTDRWILVSRNK
jgi:hypothetical protein